MNNFDDGSDLEASVGWVADDENRNVSSNIALDIFIEKVLHVDDLKQNEYSS